MAMTSVNIRMDADVKQRFDYICNELGLNISTAINVFAKAVVRQNKIPFELEIEEDPYFNEATIRRINKAIQAEENGETGILKTFEELGIV